MTAFLEGLSDGALAALPYLFEVWALPHQLPPEGDWTAWVILGGRGAGKTRAGAEWVRRMVEGATPEAPAGAPRGALVGNTYDLGAGGSWMKGESGPDRLLSARSLPRGGSRGSGGWNGLLNGKRRRGFYSAHEPEAVAGAAVR